MDYSSVDSEIIDSLDILRPRVKRFCEKISGKAVTNHVRRFNVFRDDSSIKKQSSTKNIPRAAASSTSLVLKKTSQREILEKYTVLSYTSLLRANKNPSSELSITTRDKPLIKVTVIPKSPQAQASKLRRRQSTTKKLQTTVSNHENSIHTKNLYLVVAGKKKEKVYEIKTTGSAKFSAENIKYQVHNEDDSIKEISTLKQIIQSLNMDKKKKKGKTRKENTKKLSITEDPEGVDSHNDCRCINSLRDGRCVDDRRSRVRVFGQVGLTEDERYILKCDATVDGQPIMTKILAEKPSESQSVLLNDAMEPKYRNNYDTMACFDGYCQNDNYRNLRDSNIQVDLTLRRNQNSNSRIYRSVGNQGTQVNFTVCQTNKTMSPSKRSQTIQCNYASLSKNINIIENASEHNVVKETQSPLVIISVYPKQESNETKIIKSFAVANTRPVSPRNAMNVGSNIKLDRNERNYKVSNKRFDKSPKSSRSPSPNRKNVEIQQKRKDIYQTNTKFLRTRTNSPNDLPTCSNRYKTTQNNERIKANKNPKSIDDSDIFTSKNMQKINNILMSSGKQTNTEIKKALIDDYTRRITETMYNYADKTPTLETSKVKINIDSENEYYDVQFEQGQNTTDLQIRKTLKEAASQKQEYNHSAFPENLCNMLPEKEPRGKSFSPRIAVCKKNEHKNIDIRNSKLNVRDSLEISHKREAGTSKKDAQTNKSTKRNVCCKDTDFLAPIKHFKGDSCKLPDPVERDKQIQQLLGINRGKVVNGGFKQSDIYGGVVADHGLFDCFYRRDCEKKVETKLSPHDPCSCEPTVPNYDTKHKLEKNTDQKESAVERTSLYQQLILNRNIQVFLQVEQFTKQKPIILSRKQYDKVKRTIQKTMSRKISQEKKKKTEKNSLISVGEVRKRTKHELTIPQESDKQTQTDKLHSRKEQVFRDEDEEYGTPKEKTRRIDDATKCSKPNKSQIETIVLFDSKQAKNNKDKANEIASPRQTNSSLEIHYATIGYMKRVTFSSTNVGSLSSSSILRRNESLFTIFKGRKRSVTPNLGTSDFTLPPMEGSSRSAKGLINPMDSKPKKPFLRRLMSCLVMRSRTSEVKLAVQPNQPPTTVNSSIDSYHFSTSLGAIQMGSSLYDTTASFYTSHSVLPIVNSKMKRGFFNSVREFLTSRKS